MSITTKISVLISITIVIMLAIAFFTEGISERAIIETKKQSLIQASKEILTNIYDKAQLEKTVRNFNLERVDKSTFPENEPVFQNRSTFGEVAIYEQFLNFYLEIGFLDEYSYFKLKDDESIQDLRVLGTLLILGIAILFVIYLVVLKIVSPIKKVSKEIERFSNRDFSARVKTHSKDEVADLARSFNKMAETIENFIYTREELIRDVGHELKTPIAKGKFALENIEESHSKDLIKESFKRLELLTEELIHMEKLNFKELKKELFSPETLFLESVSSLVVDEANINLSIDASYKINGDLYYLSIALKNLIENALKYTSKFPIDVVFKKDSIEVVSEGKKLDKSIEHYLKPFTRESVNRDKNGFGLGLSIVKKIVDKHGFILEYSHQEDKNSFKIIY